MLLDLVFLLLGSFGVLGAQTPAAPVAPPPAWPAVPTIECQRCAGKKVALEECWACEGAGKVACTFCRSLGPGLWRVPWDEKFTTENLAELKALKQQSADLALQLAKLMTGDVPAGHVACPGFTSHGSLGSLSGKPCRYCAARGSFECPECKGKPLRKCVECAGKGRVQRTCEACLGSARVPDPVLIPSADRALCPWCGDKRARVCGECVSGEVELTCRQCLGAKTLSCKACIGTRRKPCNKCYATGDLSQYLAAKTSNDCDQCKTKGSIDCDVCKRKGKVDCPGCSGRGRVKGVCPACQKDGVRPCGGCFLGAYAAWEQAGATCEKAGEREAATAWFEIARTRAKAKFEFELREIVTTQTEIDELQKQRTREDERFKTKLAALRAPAPK